MSINPLVLFGAGTAVGVVLQHIKSVFARISNLMVINCKVNGDAARYLCKYLQSHHRHVQKNCGALYAWLQQWAAGTLYARVYRSLDDERTHMFFVGKAPLFFKWVSSYDGWYAAQVSYIRGTIDVEDLIMKAASAFEQKCNERTVTGSGRFFVKHVIGEQKQPGIRFPNLGKKDSDEKETTGVNVPTGADDEWVCVSEAALHGGDADPLENMVLSEDMTNVVRHVTQWVNNQDWYESRGIPWKASFLFHGGPGTGKTSLVRGIGRTFDMPIYSYDLASLSNSEMYEAWVEMLANRPVIALMEDMDAVFNGRETTGKSFLTYDFFLNCLDGIDETAGVLVFITTNRVEAIDGALCVVEDGICSRPGRVDMAVEFRSLDEKGKEQMATRILAGYPQEQRELLVATNGELSPAQFQKICSDVAKRLFEEEVECLSRESLNGKTSGGE